MGRTRQHDRWCALGYCYVGFYPNMTCQQRVPCVMLAWHVKIFHDMSQCVIVTWHQHMCSQVTPMSVIWHVEKTCQIVIRQLAYIRQNSLDTWLALLTCDLAKQCCSKYTCHQKVPTFTCRDEMLPTCRGKTQLRGNARQTLDSSWFDNFSMLSLSL